MNAGRLVLLAAAGVSLASGGELIRNGGFEEVGKDSIPAGWHLGKTGEPIHENGGGDCVRVSEGAGHSGKRAVELRGSVSSFPCFLDQDLDPQQRGPLPVRGTLSFWYKVLEGTPGRPAVTVMSVAPQHRNYPGGYFLPVTFASDRQWHYAEFSYDVGGPLRRGGLALPETSAAQTAGSAFVRIFIMSFESRFSAPVRFLIDDVKFSPDGSAAFAPRLFHIVNGADADRFEVRIYVRNMAFQATAGRLRLALPAHLQAGETAEQTLKLPAGYVHGLHSSDTQGGGAVVWHVRGRRRPGDRVTVSYVSDVLEKAWQWSRELQPALTPGRVAFERGLIGLGEKVKVEVEVRNEGEADATGVTLKLIPSASLRTAGNLQRELVEVLAPGQGRTVSCEFSADTQGPAGVTAEIWQGGRKLSAKNARAWIDPAAARLDPNLESKAWKGLALVQSGDLFVSLGPPSADYGAFAVYYRHPEGFRRLASAPYLAQVTALEHGRKVEHLVRYRVAGAPTTESVALKASWDDGEGVHWNSTLDLRARGSKEEIEARYTLGVNAPRQLFAFHPAPLLAGDGTTGIRKSSAQFPGIEWLVDGESSSSQSNIHDLRDERIPHPNKVTIPVMGVVVDRHMIGMMWDPLERWDEQHDRPTPVFDVPNRTFGQANHLMGLFLPSIPAWVDPAHMEATHPYPLRPATPVSLRYSMIAADNADDLTPVSIWYEKHGVPDPPPLDRTYAEELALCRLPASPEFDLERTITNSLVRAERALAKQSAGGWWSWSYSDSLMIQILNWTHANNLDPFGHAGDTAIGAYSPVYANRYDNLDLFRAARYTGDPRFVKAAEKALRRATEFRRPEGSQPWELPLHTADILGAAYGVTAFLEGYKVTGSPELLERARWWAKSALPFIYTWSAPDQPHMKYGAIAVYGGSFLDYLLLGQAITWCALDYAEALIDLVPYDPQGPWRTVAQGILHNVILQHEMTGRNAGQWPDWRDLTKNRVLADIWYANPRPGEVLNRWLHGIPAAKTTMLETPTGPVHLTSECPIANARFDRGIATVELQATRQAACQLAVGGAGAISNARLVAPEIRAVSKQSRSPNYKLVFLRLDRTDADQVTLEFAIDTTR